MNHSWQESIGQSYCQSIRNLKTIKHRRKLWASSSIWVVWLLYLMSFRINLYIVPILIYNAKCMIDLSILIIWTIYFTVNIFRNSHSLWPSSSFPLLMVYAIINFYKMLYVLLSGSVCEVRLLGLQKRQILFFKWNERNFCWYYSV